MKIAIAAHLFQVSASILAVLLARRRRDHRPVAFFLTAMALADGVRWALRTYMILPVQQARAAQGIDPLAMPLQGAARAAAHVDQSLFLAWPFALVALAFAVFPRRHPWFLAIGWTLTVVALVLAYPELRGLALRPIYLSVELAAALVSIGLFIQWMWRRERLTLVRLLTMFIIVIDCGTLGTAYRFGLFTHWELAQVMYLVLYAALVITQGIAWTFSKSESSQSG